MIKAHEIQGVLALDNSFNRVGLDHVLLVRVASTAVAAAQLGATRDQIANAVSNAWIDGGALRTYRHAPNIGSRKSWAAGDATSRGVWHALLALRGEMGYPSALSAPRPGASTMCCFAASPFSLPQPFGCYVMENVLFKVSYPAEFHAQTAAEAAIALHAQVAPRLDQVTRIVIETQQAAIRIIDKTGPLANPADRDHCLQYMVAVPLIFGRLTAADYEQEVAADPRIDALRDTMQVRENLQFTRDYYDPAKRVHRQRRAGVLPRRQPYGAGGNRFSDRPSTAARRSRATAAGEVRPRRAGSFRRRAGRSDPGAVCRSGAPGGAARPRAHGRAGHGMTAAQARDRWVLPIQGMTCAGCARRVEQALSAVPGVTRAEVNLASERAAVETLAGSVHGPDLIAAVRGAGYDASIDAGDAAAETRLEQARAQRQHAEGLQVLVAAALSAPLLLPMLGVALNPWLQLLLAAVVQFVLGARFYRGGWKALRGGRQHGPAGEPRHHRRLRSEPLPTAAAPGLRVVLRGIGGGHHAGAVRQVAGSARQAPDHRARIRALMALRPERARVAARRAARVELPHRRRSRIGDRRDRAAGRARCRSMARCVSGASDVDESLFTGESLPVAKQRRRPRDRRLDQRPRAAARRDHARSASDSTLARIDRVGGGGAGAQGAGAAAGRSGRSAVFVPVVLLAGAARAARLVGWARGDVAAALLAAVSVLVIACPARSVSPHRPR